MLPDNILFTQRPKEDLVRFLEARSYSSLLILVDDNTKRHCLPLIDGITSSTIAIESGEEHKNLATCQKIWEGMTSAQLDRHAAMIVLGGGVLGDMGGFCAATYKRGIDFILIPTTLLAQVDASIGGKLGVDFNHLKNHIGVFQSPALTLIHSGFMNTLPQGELRSGFAEVIKHCLISDNKMWREISQKSLSDQDWERLAKHSVEFKARVTVEDPREKGLRKILNFGHTVGHAVESLLLSKGNRILHGEAIAIGMIAEAFLSHERSLLSDDELHAITKYIIKIFNKVSLSNEDISASADLTLQDKKNRNNQILCVLLEGIGACRWDQAITLEDVKRSLKYYADVQM